MGEMTVIYLKPLGAPRNKYTVFRMGTVVKGACSKWKTARWSGIAFDRIKRGDIISQIDFGGRFRTMTLPAWPGFN